MNYNHSLCQDVATCLRFDFTFRNMALGACSTFSRIGGMVVPFLIALVSCFIFYRSVLNINSHQPNIYQLTYLFCYESEHDLRSRMNNLSGWKRFRKNSGLTGNKTLIFATDRMQPFIHCSGRSRGGARGARSPPPLSQGLDDRALHFLSEGLDPPLHWANQPNWKAGHSEL